MMLSFRASRGTVFHYDPSLEREIWITTRAPAANVAGLTVTIPFEDLLEFSAKAAEVPEHGSDAEIDTLLNILDRCGVFDQAQPREVTRRRLAERLKAGL